MSCHVVLKGRTLCPLLRLPGLTVLTDYHGRSFARDRLGLLYI